MNDPLVSVVIPTYNRKEMLIRLIKSIKKSTYKNLEIIVVDDASTDGTYEEIKRKFPDVKIVRNEKNLMVSASRNIGIKKSKGKYVFLIDDDNVVEKNCIKELVKVMEKYNNIGILGPLMYYYSNPKKIWCAGGKLNFFLQPFHILKNKSNFIFKNYIIKKIDYFPNAYMVRRTIFSFNIFHDEINFSHNWGEQDFCFKVKNLGFEICTLTKSIVWHDIDYDDRITRLGIKKTYDQAKTRILFRRKYGNIIQNLFFWLAIFPISTLYYFYKIMKNGNINILVSYFKGTIDGILYDL